MIKDRIEKIQRLLKPFALDVLLVIDPIDLYYLTGMKLSNGMLFVAAKEIVLCVDGRYVEEAKASFPFQVILNNNSSHFEKSALKFCSGKKIGFDSSKTNYQVYLQYKKEMLSSSLEPVKNITKDIRKIKSNKEISFLKQAAQLNKRGLDYARSILKEGVCEDDIARSLEVFWLQNGSDGVAFETNISFGANSSMPHHRAGKKNLKKDDVVLMDVGVVFNGYCSDMTRTFLRGTIDSEMKRIYEIVQEAQRLALEKCRPGISLGELDFAARDFIEKQGFGENFSHGLGHGIGLEVHEFPTIKDIEPYSPEILEEGMAITIEPGIYLPGKGGVRIEDSIVITQSSYESLV